MKNTKIKNTKIKNTIIKNKTMKNNRMILNSFYNSLEYKKFNGFHQLVALISYI